MGIRLKHFPEHALDLCLYSGAISLDELLAHFRRLDANAKWLSYFDPLTDLSGIDLAHFPAMKHAITAKEYEADAGGEKRHALVNVSKANELFTRFWCLYAADGVRIAHQRVMFATLEEACAWLDLSPAACSDINLTIAFSGADAGAA